MSGPLNVSGSDTLFFTALLSAMPKVFFGQVTVQIVKENRD